MVLLSVSFIVAVLWVWFCFGGGVVSLWGLGSGVQDLSSLSRD